MHYRLPTIPPQLAAGAMVSELGPADKKSACNGAVLFTGSRILGSPLILRVISLCSFALMETDSLRRSLTYLSIPDTCSLGSGLTPAGRVVKTKAASVLHPSRVALRAY